jgi:hypothetical protein
MTRSRWLLLVILTGVTMPHAVAADDQISDWKGTTRRAT